MATNSSVRKEPFWSAQGVWTTTVPPHDLAFSKGRSSSAEFDRAKMKIGLIGFRFIVQAAPRLLIISLLVTKITLIMT